MPTGPALERGVESGSAGEVGGCSERRDPALTLAHYRGCCEERCSTGYPEGRTGTNSPAWCPPDLLETLVSWQRALWVNQEGIRGCSDPYTSPPGEEETGKQGNVPFLSCYRSP